MFSRVFGPSPSPQVPRNSPNTTRAGSPYRPRSELQQEERRQHVSKRLALYHEDSTTIASSSSYIHTDPEDGKRQCQESRPKMQMHRHAPPTLPGLPPFTSQAILKVIQHTVQAIVQATVQSAVEDSMNKLLLHTEQQGPRDLAQSIKDVDQNTTDHPHRQFPNDTTQQNPHHYPQQVSQPANKPAQPEPGAFASPPNPPAPVPARPCSASKLGCSRSSAPAEYRCKEARLKA